MLIAISIIDALLDTLMFKDTVSDSMPPHVHTEAVPKRCCSLEI